MHWSRYLWYLCGTMGVWTCGVEEEGLGDVTRCFWVEGLNSFEELVSNHVTRLSVRLDVLIWSIIEGLRYLGFARKSAAHNQHYGRLGAEDRIIWYSIRRLPVSSSDRVHSQKSIMRPVPTWRC